MVFIPPASGDGLYGAGAYPPAISNYELNGLTVSAANIRNDLVANGGQGVATQVDSFVANGTTIRFNLSYAPDFAAPIVPSLLVGGVPKSVAAFSGSNSAASWQVFTIAPGVAFLVPTGDTVPPNGTPIALTYQYSLEAIVRLFDTTSIANLATYNPPNWGHYETSPATSSTGHPAAISAAMTQLVQYSEPVVDIAVTIEADLESYGVEEGQTLHIDINRFSYSADCAIIKCSHIGTETADGQYKLQLLLET